MFHRVYIHTNDRQAVGALVSAYSLKRNSAQPETFNVEIINTKDFPYLAEKEGQAFLRGGTTRTWTMNDLQSFTPLRFMPPKLMNHQGRAVIIDPDIFAVGDICELLNRDMRGAVVMGRPRSKDKKTFCLATSAMLLDCAGLKHWQPEAEFDELFRFERDYKEWICLAHEPRENIGFFEDEWNDFDRLTKQTKLLHNTKRKTQPWKTGLPVDFTPADKLKRYPALRMLRRFRDQVLGTHTLRGRYARHPDPKQEGFFFSLLRECLDEAVVDEALIREEMKRNHIRHDAFKLIEAAEPLPR